MSDESTLPLDRAALIAALMDTLREVSGIGVLYSQAVAARLGVNSTDLECLGHIAARGPITAGALADASGLTSGAITGVIDRLERSGFVVREADPRDRRKVLVRVLPAAAEKAEPLFAPMADASRSALSTYDDNDLDLLLGFLGRLQNAGASALAALRDAAE